MPSAVYRLRTAMRIWISATCLSKSRAMSDWPISFRQCVLVSTRLRRWYPLKRRHKVRPKYRCALTASFRAIAPALVGFQGLAFLRCGITAWAFLAAMASWHLRVSYALSAVTLPISWSDGIWFRRSDNTGASPTLLLVISTARTSNTLRQFQCEPYAKYVALSRHACGHSTHLRPLL